MKHGEIANMWFCGCICFSVQRRLSPLEEIHKEEWLRAEQPGSSVWIREAMVKAGAGCSGV